MEAEPENDNGDPAKNDESSSVPTRKSKQTKRDPNEEIPENWQRRMHLADRIPVLRTEDALEADSKRVYSNKSDSLSYSVGEFAFIVENTQNTNDALREDLGASPPSFRVARLLAVSTTSVKVNWLIRPSDVMFRAIDTRELYVSFETSTITLERLRGRCTVQCRSDIRNFSKYRERTAHFWYSRLYYSTTRRLYDIVPTLAMKSLGSRLLANLSLTANYGVVERSETKTLCDQPRKRKLQEEDEEEDPSYSEAEIEQLAAQRAEWPFRYFDHQSREFCEPCCIPLAPRVGHEFQLDIDDWPGRPLAFYSAVLAEGSSSTELRYVEGSEESSHYEVDPKQPWAVEMPKGYIPRGGDATSTPVSLPLPGITEFVSRCQSSHAQNIEVKPSCLNFLDACCSIFVHSNTTANAFITVSRLSRKQLHEPELTADELAAFRAAIDPFRSKSWHEVYRAVASKPIVELCQFYWVEFPLLPSVPPDRLLVEDACSSSGWPEETRLTNVTPDGDSDSFVCAICYTSNAPEWNCLPSCVTLENKLEYSDSKVALCARCARLWYRYKSRWEPPSEVNKLVEQNESQNDTQSSRGAERIDPELIDDANSFFTESERREKRRQAAQEKREALLKRREELKVAKKAAKEAKKTGTEPSSDVQKLLDSPNAEPEAEVKTTLKEKTKPKIEAKRKQPSEGPDKKTSRQKKKVTSEAKVETEEPEKVELKKAPSDDSSEEDTDTEALIKGKRKSQHASQMSLDQVDQILDAIDEELPPEAAEYPNYCVVCGQLDPSMPQNTCASCGLNVHIACYGQAKLPSADSNVGTAVWFCDCCRNSRGESQNDLSYQCLFCPPRAPCYGHWLNGTSTAAPDVLKNTMEKTWCHLRCALFTPGVKFGNTNELSDIDISALPPDAWMGRCAICLGRPPQARALTLPMQYGGSSQTALPAQPKQGVVMDLREGSAQVCSQQLAAKLNGIETDQNSIGDHTSSVKNLVNNLSPASASHQSSEVGKGEHSRSTAVTTSTNSSQRAQQMIQPETLASMGSKVKCELCDERFHVSCAADSGYQFGLTRDQKPRAVIVCNKHKHVDLVPMSRLDLNLNLSAMQLYASAYKKSKRRFVTASERCNWNDRLEVVDATTTPRKHPCILPLLETQVTQANETRERCYDWAANHNLLRCHSCGLKNASYWHLGPQEQTVTCPLCHCNFEPVKVSTPSNDATSSWKAVLVDKLYEGLDAAHAHAKASMTG